MTTKAGKPSRAQQNQSLLRKNDSVFSRPRSSLSKLRSTDILLLLVAFRLVNALTTKTFFQPDEYYQSLEPAWNFAFGGDSSAWITWEWHQHLRTAIHPALFSLAYRLADTIAHHLSLTDPAREQVLLAAPKVVQAIVAALGDYYTWKLAGRIYGNSSNARSATLILTCISPWQWFCSTRTFSNSLETTLTVMALNSWPWIWTVNGNANNANGKGTVKSKSTTSEEGPRSTRLTAKQHPGLRLCLVLAAFATVLRPTNILIWTVIASYTIYRAQKTQHIVVLLRESIICGTTVLLISACVDRIFFGLWVLPAYNFLNFNVFQSLAVFYGNNDWHYYISQGYPLQLTTALPFTVIGMYNIIKVDRPVKDLSQASQNALISLAIACIILPAALSVLSHKEVRFIYPLLPSLHIIAALPATWFFGLGTPHADTQSDRRLKNVFWIAVILGINFTIAYYTTQIHNSGLIPSTEYFRNEYEKHYSLPQSKVTDPKFPRLQPQHNMTIGFLMPCHSVPWRSHLQHVPKPTQPGIQAWALTCEPPLHITDPVIKHKYLDEADVFYTTPDLWLRDNMYSVLPRSGNDRTKPQPGIYAVPPNQRNNRLLNEARPNTGTSKHITGLDMIDLLPFLRTSPSTPPSKVPFKRPWPDYLAFFAQLEPTMHSLLYRSGYVECQRIFNSHFHDDWRRTGDIVVWCLFPERSSSK